jgi:hypothetical protein
VWAPSLLFGPWLILGVDRDILWGSGEPFVCPQNKLRKNTVAERNLGVGQS